MRGEPLLFVTTTDQDCAAPVEVIPDGYVKSRCAVPEKSLLDAPPAIARMPDGQVDVNVAVLALPSVPALETIVALASSFAPDGPCGPMGPLPPRGPRGPRRPGGMRTWT